MPRTQVLIRCGTDYDTRAEACILTDHTRAAGGHEDLTWIREALPAA